MGGRERFDRGSALGVAVEIYGMRDRGRTSGGGKLFLEFCSALESQRGDQGAARGTRTELCAFRQQVAAAGGACKRGICVAAARCARAISTARATYLSVQA